MQYFKIKINNLYFFFFLVTSLSFTSCNSSDSKEVAVTENTTVAKPQKNNPSSAELKQNGDYSQLFTPELKDCEFLTVSEFATAINFPENQISLEDNGYTCTYIFTDDKGLVTRFGITNVPIKKADMEKEIQGSLDDEKSLGKDNRLMEVRKSETGDTYLIMSQNRNVKLLNNSYEIFTNVSYNVKFGTKEKDVDFINSKMDEMRNKAFAIANALLKNYKK